MFYFQLQVHCGCEQVLVQLQTRGLSGDLHDWNLRNCLGDEHQSHYSVFPVIDWWPVGCVLSLAW